MTVDLVVVNRKTPGDLALFLRSLDLHPPSCPWALWVVNVEPDVEDIELANRWIDRRDIRATHLAFASNVGYNRAANTAGGRGDSDVVALFNADVELRPGTVDTVLAALHEHPDWGIAGPAQVAPGAGGERFTAAGIFGTLAEPKHRGWQSVNRGQYEDIRGDAVTVAGSAFFIRRVVWDELRRCPIFQVSDPGTGPLLSTFGYWGETYTCYHAQAHGWKCGYVGTATMVHRWHRASPQGGAHEQAVPRDQALFRAACDEHGIAHD